MDEEVIALVDLREFAVNSEFITVLTEGSGYIISMIARLIFFTEDGNVMISTVDRRTHQVSRAGIYTDILLVSMFSWMALVISPSYGPVIKRPSSVHRDTSPFQPEREPRHILYELLHR